MKATPEIPDRPKKYPSQYEARLVIDALEALNRIYTGGASDSHAASLVDSWEKAMQPEYTRIFASPETSPWCIELKRGAHGIRRILKWREGW